MSFGNYGSFAPVSFGESLFARRTGAYKATVRIRADTRITKKNGAGHYGLSRIVYD